jgi:thiamine-phosphate pyrophosphorylase
LRVARLHVVTDDATVAQPAFPARAAAVLEAGGARLALHLRAHAASARTLHGIAQALIPIARASGAGLIVNDRVDIALAVEADGVQLGVRSIPWRTVRSLLPDRAIGASVHGRVDALQAAADGTDWLVLGTIYATASHPGTSLLGEVGLSGIAAVVATPVLAIGGVRPEHVPGLLAAGAHGAAVLSGIWHALHPADAVQAYLAAFAGETAPAGEEGHTWKRSG